MSAPTKPLKVITTYYDDYHGRQHFKGFDNGHEYCMVEIERGVFQLHSFVQEPECPIRADIDIVEVDKQGHVVKQIQEAARA